MSGASARENAAFVLQVQRWLVSRGHELTVDGHAGSVTARAFAQEVGIEAPPSAAPEAPTAPRQGLGALHGPTLKMVEAVLADPEAAALGLRVVSVYRSAAEQQALYDQGRTKPGKIVTNAPPGHSYHEVRRAVDMAPEQLMRLPGWDPASPLWARLAALYEKHGLKAGHRWKKPDSPHAENSWCVDCRHDFGPRGSSHFDAEGNCKLAGGVAANDEQGAA